jgi:hypothetical protein
VGATARRTFENRVDRSSDPGSRAKGRLLAEEHEPVRPGAATTVWRGGCGLVRPMSGLPYGSARPAFASAARRCRAGGPVAAPGLVKEFAGMRWLRSHAALRRFVSRVVDYPRGPTRAELRATLERYEVGWPPGHFYSPIPDLADVRRRDASIFPAMDATLPGLDLREDAQLTLLRDLGALAAEQPWSSSRRPPLRYGFENPNFQHGEAMVLYALLRLLRPRRVVEVGSGWSSCVVLDVNERFLDDSVACTFIDPYPDLLGELARGDDLDIRAVPVQEVGLDVFAELGRDDMLIIDSTHVAKVGSDVNYLMFDVLPRIAPGVLVHIHDIYYPFEYPRAWVYQGRAWNEIYLVHAFLMYNSRWEIVFFNSFMGARHSEALVTHLPQTIHGAGSSLWLRRTSEQ